MKIFSFFLIASSAIILAISCKEQAPSGLIKASAIVAKDSDYVSSILPAQQARTIMVEEFTGVQCANCPVGASLLKNLQNANPGRIVAAKIHSDFLATPIKPNDPDFRIPDADALYASLGAQSKPSFGIDRMFNATATPYVFDKNDLNSKIPTRLTQASIVNIDLEKLVAPSNDSVTLRATFTFTQATSEPLAYHVYWVENDIEAAQDSVGIEIDAYRHEEILRACITPVFTGSALPSGTTAQGQVYIRGLKIPKPAKVSSMAKSALIVFITKNGTSKEVLQASEIKL
jgi:hypothetical protein